MSTQDQQILDAWDQDRDGKLSVFEQARRYGAYWVNSFTQPVDTYTQLYREQVEGAPYQKDPDGALGEAVEDEVLDAEYSDGKPANTAAKLKESAVGSSLINIFFWGTLLVAGGWTLYAVGKWAGGLATLAATTAASNPTGVGALIKAVR